MKKIIKLLVLCFCMMAFQSCFTTLAIIDSQVNRDIMEKPNYEENIKLVKNNYPELYKMYCSGAIKITDVEKYNKDGKQIIKVWYKFRK